MEDLKEQLKQWKIQPPAPDACPICGTKHPPEHPHNAQSLYYQYSFAQKYGRWPSWSDACSHCSDEITAITRQVIESKGVKFD